jgi:hypothetical protein
MPDRRYPKDLPLEVRGYVAGIIDGEGTISINRASFPRQPQLSVRYTAILSVGNTDYKVMELLISLFGGNVVTRPPTEKHKRFYVWQARGPHARAILEEHIGPYLLLKRAQSDLLIEFVRDFRSFKGGPRTRRISPEELARREAIWRAIKALNRPGPARAYADG